MPSHPYHYYTDQVLKSVSSFKDYPQDVIIMVRAYFRSMLLFEDATNHNQVVASQDLFARRTGEPLHYHQLGSKYMPKHPPYQFLSPLEKSFSSHNDSSFTPGSTEVIYVRPVRHLMSGSYHSVGQDSDYATSKGTITVKYQVNRGTETDPDWATIDSVKRSGRIGQPFHRSKYLDIQNLPSGYQLSKQRHGPVIDGNQVTEFKSVPQDFDVAVSNKSTYVHQITGSLLYEDQKTHDIQKIIKIHGSQDARINYDLYKGPKYMPSGYRFAKLDDDTGHFLEPDASYVMLIKKVPKKVSASIVYEDIHNDHTEKLIPINGPKGMPIDFDSYTSPDDIPSGYHFVKLASGTDRRLDADKKYKIYIKSNQPSRVEARVLYQDVDNNQIKLSKKIKGVLNQPLGKYTSKDSQYIPDGYHFVDLVSNHGHYLQPNSTYIVLIKKNRQKPQVTGQVLYKDITTDKVISTSSITGTLRKPIDYRRYVNGNSIPDGYSYVKLDYRNERYLEPDMKYVILVRPESKSSLHMQGNRNHNLPQTHHSKKDIGSILMALGSSLSALGKALDHHQI